MGLPTVIIEFKKRAESLIRRSGNGVVALLFKDSDSPQTVEEFTKIASLGGPAKVLVETYEDDILAGLGKLQTKRWNYLAAPTVDDTGDVAAIKEWITEQRGKRKTFKTVLPNCVANNEAVINFTTTDIKVGEKTYTTAEYTARVAGLCAGTPLDHSVTYLVLPEVESIAESTTPDEDIDAGQFILINDGEKIKVGRGINSLTTIAGEKTVDMQKIKNVNTMDLIVDDARDMFQDHFTGMANSFQNKCIFTSSFNEYLADLAHQGALNREFDNHCELDVDAIAEYLGDISGMSEEQIRQADTKNFIFLAGGIRFQDAIEDLKFRIYI